MTFEEAHKKALEAKAKWGGGSSEAWLINSLEALGLLKLEDRRNADERLAESLTAAFSFDTDVKEMTIFRESLAKNGLQIVALSSSPHDTEDAK